jgi:hypothetical protein
MGFKNAIPEGSIRPAASAAFNRSGAIRVFEKGFVSNGSRSVSGLGLRDPAASADKSARERSLRASLEIAWRSLPGFTALARTGLRSARRKIQLAATVIQMAKMSRNCPFIAAVQRGHIHRNIEGDCLIGQELCDAFNRLDA